MSYPFAHWHALPLLLPTTRSREQIESCIGEGVWVTRSGCHGRILGKGTKRDCKRNRMPEPPPDSNIIHFPGAFYRLYTVETPCFSNGGLHDDYSLLRHQRTEGSLALSLAIRMRLPSCPSLSDRLRGGIREHVTHVWVAHPPEKTVIARFYNPV